MVAGKERWDGRNSKACTQKIVGVFLSFYSVEQITKTAKETRFDPLITASSHDYLHVKIDPLITAMPPHTKSWAHGRAKILACNGKAAATNMSG